MFATATEDMDALTFGTTVLLRHLTFSEARKMPIKEISVQKILDEMKFTQVRVEKKGKTKEKENGNRA